MCYGASLGYSERKKGSELWVECGLLSKRGIEVLAYDRKGRLSPRLVKWGSLLGREETEL